MIMMTSIPRNLYLKIIGIIFAAPIFFYAIFCVWPNYSVTEHDKLNNKTALVFAKQELVRVLGKPGSSDGGAVDPDSGCLVASYSGPKSKNYTYKFSGDKPWFVNVSSTPDMFGLETNVIRVGELHNGQPVVWAGTVPNCGH